MGNLGDYIEVKHKYKDNIFVEIFIVCKDDELYKMFKRNKWKSQNNQVLVDGFKGYNDKHKAMKFTTKIVGSEEFAEKLKKMLNAEISLFSFSSMDYNSYNEILEQQKRRNYDAFMSGLRGDYKF